MKEGIAMETVVKSKLCFSDLAGKIALSPKKN